MKQSILSRACAFVITGCIMCSLAATVRAASNHDNCQSDSNLLNPLKASESTQITPDPLPTFSDVTSTNSFSWAFEAVGYVRNAGYMAGSGGGKFSPKRELTRAEIVTIIRRVAKKIYAGDDDLPQPYNDVKKTDYYYAPVAWAYSTGLAQIIQTGNTKFGPKEALTRAQIAEVLWTLAKTKLWTIGVPNPFISCPFTDIRELTENQKKAIKWCYSAGIMTGTDSNTFSPYGKVNRAQMAVMCYKLDVYVTQNRAFCVGTDWNPGNTLNTTDVVENARDCFQQLGYRVKCVTEPIKKDLQDSHNIRSKALFFAGHGSPEVVQVHYKNMGGDHKTGVCSADTHTAGSGFHYVGIEGNMQLVDLAVFAGCSTAQGSNNIAKLACRYGAKNSLGWSTSIYFPTMYTWLNNFTSALSNGTSVLCACILADIETSMKPGCAMKNWVFYYHPGELNFCPKINSEIVGRTTVSSAEHLPRDVLASYAGSTHIQGRDLTAEIAAILQDINSDFNLPDYTTHVYDHGSGLFTVDFVRTIQGFETNSVYSAFVEGNTVTALCDNTKAISTSEESCIKLIHDRLALTDGIMQAGPGDVQSRELVEAMQLAMEQTQASPLKEVDGQRYYYYYDMEQKQAYILVYTDYYYDGTEAKGVDLYEYKLEMEE